jgi:predicted CopG family antitoxin
MSLSSNAVYLLIQGHRTITISDQAYTTLKRKKKEGESFTDVILRELAEGNADWILSVVMSPDFPDRELAENVRKSSEEHRKRFRMRIK